MAVSLSPLMARRVGVACVLLALVSAAVTWRIEQLNHAVGDYLPRRFAGEATPQWRRLPFATEEQWRRTHLRTVDGRTEARALSAPELQRMRADVKRAKAWNQLRMLVATMGLAQYVLGPLVMLGAAVAMRQQPTRLRKAFCFAAAMTAAVCLGFAIDRGYFTALGW